MSTKPKLRYFPTRFSRKTGRISGSTRSKNTANNANAIASPLLLKSERKIAEFMVVMVGI